MTSTRVTGSVDDRRTPKEHRTVAHPLDALALPNTPRSVGSVIGERAQVPTVERMWLANCRLKWSIQSQYVIEDLRKYLRESPALAFTACYSSASATASARDKPPKARAAIDFTRPRSQARAQARIVVVVIEAEVAVEQPPEE